MSDLAQQLKLQKLFAQQRKRTGLVAPVHERPNLMFPGMAYAVEKATIDRMILDGNPYEDFPVRLPRFIAGGLRHLAETSKEPQHHEDCFRDSISGRFCYHDCPIMLGRK